MLILTLGEEDSGQVANATITMSAKPDEVPLAPVTINNPAIANLIRPQYSPWSLSRCGSFCQSGRILVYIVAEWTFSRRRRARFPR
jgi:hypothetical protein